MSSRTSFSNGEAGEIVGVPASSIEQWCRAGLLRPQQHGRGRGHHRRFDSDDLVLMLIARELTRAGLSLPQLQQAFTVLRTKLEATRSAWRSAALFRDYSETIKLLARTFGRGNTYDVWLREATAQLSHMERFAKARLSRTSAHDAASQRDGGELELLVAMSRLPPSGVTLKP